MHNPLRYVNSSPEVIRLVVTTSIRYPLSLRQVEDIVLERGIDICHETVRYGWNRFGPVFAAESRTRRVRHGAYALWRWHLDEVFVRINGETHYLWRAVDHDGGALEVFSTKRWHREAALRFLKRAMKRYGRPATLVTDKLQSYRAENSHLLCRRREGALAKFREVETVQKFAAVHASTYNHFNHQRHLNRRAIFKQDRAAALAEWRPLAA